MDERIQLLELLGLCQADLQTIMMPLWNDCMLSLHAKYYHDLRCAIGTQWLHGGLNFQTGNPSVSQSLGKTGLISTCWSQNIYIFLLNSKMCCVFQYYNRPQRLIIDF